MRKKKKKLAEEEALAQELKELEEDNADLQKDYSRHDDGIAEDKVIVAKFREKIAAINKTLAEAKTKGKKGGGLADIKIRFGPTSPVRLFV